MRLTVAGLGKLGSPLAAVLARRGHDVVGIDPYSPDAVDALNDGEPPVPEPALRSLLAELPPGRLTASKDYDPVAASEATFVVVPTPSDLSGRFDPAAVVDAVAAVARVAGPDHLVVVSSTLFPGTMASRVAPAAGGLPCVYSPFFIALGQVVADLLRPPVVLIGSESPSAAAACLRALRPPGGRTVFANWANAEIAKLALNAALTAKLAYALTVAEACEATPGADARVVLEAVGADPRIGPKFLAPGGPAGGPCLPRDTVALAAWLRDAGCPPTLPDAVAAVHGRQAPRIAEWAAGFDSVAVLGLSYKPGTPVVDASLGVEVAVLLADAGVAVYAHDPEAHPHGVRLCATAAQAVAAADAVLVTTGWAAYADLDFGGRPTLDVHGICAPQPGLSVLGRGPE